MGSSFDGTVLNFNASLDSRFKLIFFSYPDPLVAELTVEAMDELSGKESSSVSDSSSEDAFAFYKSILLILFYSLEFNNILIQ